MSRREDHAKAANDMGPSRYLGGRAIPVRELAGHLELDEEKVRDFFFEHDEEISFRLFEAAVDILVELGLREGLIPLEEPPEPEPSGCPTLAPGRPELELLEP